MSKIVDEFMKKRKTQSDSPFEQKEKTIVEKFMYQQNNPITKGGVNQIYNPENDYKYKQSLTTEQLMPPKPPPPSFMDNIKSGIGNAYNTAENTLSRFNNFIQPVVQPIRDFNQSKLGRAIQNSAMNVVPGVGQVNQFKNILGMVSPKLVEPLDVAQRSFFNSATLGVNNYLNPPTQAEIEARDRNGFANTVGDLAGYAVPGAGIEKGIAKFAPKLIAQSTEKLLPKAIKASARGAIDGAITGGVSGAVDSAANNEPILKGSAQRALEFGGGGAVLGGAIPVAGKLGGKLISGIDNKLTKGAEEAAYNMFGDLPRFDSIKTKQVELPTIKNQPSIIGAPSTESNITKPISQKFRSELPDTAEELESLIKGMEENQKVGVKINLQLFSDAQQKLEQIKLGKGEGVSQFRTNTIERSTMMDEPTLQELGVDFAKYDKQTVAQWQTGAENAVANNRDKVIQGIKDAPSINGGQQAHEANIIAKELHDQYKATGDISKFKSWVKLVSEKTRETARALKGTDTAWEKHSTDGLVIKAIRDTDNTTKAILDQNPTLKNAYNQELKDITAKGSDIKNATETAIDEVVKTQTDFPKILSDRISSALNPKTPEDVGFIRTMLKDLFGEASDSIKFPKVAKPDNSIRDLGNAYKYREYAGEIRNQAKELLKKEFEGDPKALKALDDYFNKGFNPPHSQKLLNDVISKRLKGAIPQVKSTDGGMSKPDLGTWVKDWYASGKEKTGKFIDSVMNEVGLTGDEARSLKNQLDSKIQAATKAKKDALLESVMATKGKPGAKKSAVNKLSELTNIGLLENEKFANRISEKVSPVIKQMMTENNLNMGDIVKGALQKDAKAVLLRDVFKNARVDDREVVKLLALVNSEFKGLANAKQKQILESMVKPRNAATPKTMVENLREKINLGVYGDDLDSALQDAVKQKYNLPTLTDSDVKFIVDTMDSVKDNPIRSEQYLEAMAKVEKLILEKTPARLSQKVGAGGFISMLLNPSTQLMNLGGNLSIGAAEQASNPIRRVFDEALYNSKNYSSGFKTAGKSNAKTMVEGGKLGLRQVKRDMLGGKDFRDIKSIKDAYETFANPINTDLTNTAYGDKFESGSRLAFDNKPMRVLENLTSTGMKVGDLPFNKAYFDDAVQQMMTANKAKLDKLSPEALKAATDDIMNTAFQVSTERTFKDNNLLSRGAVTIKNLPSEIARKLGKDPTTTKSLGTELLQVVANSQIPFAKTPANLIKRGMEYSPLGIAEGLVKLQNNKGAMTMMKQREIVDRLTRGTVGTGLLGLGAVGYKSGLITDSRDENANVEKLKQQNGILPDSLSAMGRTFDLKKSQPFTTPIIAGSRLAQGKGGDAVTSVVDSISGAINQYSDMSMLQNIAKLSQLFASSETANPPDKAKILIDIAATLPKQYTPAIVKKIAYAMDPFERNLNSDSSLGYAVNSIVGKLPGVSKSFPAKVDLYGNPIKTYDGDNNLLNTMANPYISTSKKENPISNEALRLNKAEIDGDLKTEVIPKAVSKELGKESLSIEQQNQYQKLMGDKVQSRITSLLNDPQYAGLNDEDKAKVFGKSLDIARTEAKNEMLKSLGISTKKTMEEKIETVNNQKLYNKFVPKK